MKDAVREALERSQSAFPNTTSIMEVRVTNRATSDWNQSQPELSHLDAALLLATPLRLVLEDRLTDKHFLLCIAPKPLRKTLERALEQGWCRVEHGGGLPNMLRYLATLEEKRIEKLRNWVLFDRDTQPSGAPSQDSQDVENACKDKALPHRQLERRSIENYLPLQALYKWVDDAPGPNKRSERQEKVDRFKAVPTPGRYHLDLKKMLSSSIAKLFREELFTIEHHWLTADGQKPEIDLIMQSLFERM